MPYAVFSKRTRKINRIVNELSSLLPSEAVIEVDEEVNYPRDTITDVQGQEVNTIGLRLFSIASGVPSPKPWIRSFDGNDRPTLSKLEPTFIKPADPDGNDVQAHIDLPLPADPFAWTAEELAAVKYESILANNYPYHVVIGEEFLNTDHIDTAESSDYTLIDSKCVLAPGGTLQSTKLQFTTAKRVETVIEELADYWTRFVFDTVYFSTEPELPEGVQVYWKGTKWEIGYPETDWEPFVTDEEMATTETGESVATALESITVKIMNLTPFTFDLENYVLFLRLRNMHAVPE